jgi:hypothetical protein
LKISFTQLRLVVAYSYHIPVIFPNPNLTQRLAVQHTVEVHVLPGWCQPVTVPVSGLVMGDEEVIHPFIIVWVVVMPKVDGHKGSVIYVRDLEIFGKHSLGRY